MEIIFFVFLPAHRSRLTSKREMLIHIILSVSLLLLNWINIESVCPLIEQYKWHGAMEYKNRHQSFNNADKNLNYIGNIQTHAQTKCWALPIWQDWLLICSPNKAICRDSGQQRSEMSTMDRTINWCIQNTSNAHMW